MIRAYLSRNWQRLALAFVVLTFGVAGVHAGLIDAKQMGLLAGGAMMLNFETVAGTVVAVSAAVPATYDQAGYNALAWSNVGEITDVGNGQGLGRTYNTTEHAPVASRQRIKKKGSFALADFGLMLAWDEADAGQDILRAAETTDAIISVKIIKQGGNVRYFTAQVGEFQENFGKVDDINVGKVTLFRQTDVVYNPAP